jgi:hypothetical protein
MAKDQKGHGSEKRDGSSGQRDPVEQTAVFNRLAAARLNPDHPLGALAAAVARGTPIAGKPASSGEYGGHAYDTPMSGGQPVVSNAHAAATLAGGGDKSAPVPVHGAMVGQPAPANLASLNKTYNRNENNNAHSENIALLAKNFGTPGEHAQAKEIISERNKQGSLPSSTKSVANVRDWQYGVHQKYIGQLNGSK